MKTFLIVILAAALAGAAAITRPSEEHFKDWYRQQAEKQNAGLLDKIFGSRADSFLKNCTYHNRFLWADIEHDGKVVYTGAFSHWIRRGPAKEK